MLTRHGATAAARRRTSPAGWTRNGNASRRSIASSLQPLTNDRGSVEQDLTSKFEQDLARGIEEERQRLDKLRLEQQAASTEEHRRVEDALRQQFEAEVVRRVAEERLRLEALHQESEAAAREDRRQLEQLLQQRVESEIGRKSGRRAPPARRDPPAGAGEAHVKERRNSKKSSGNGSRLNRAAGWKRNGSGLRQSTGLN